MTIRTEDVTPDHWPALEALFGASGACGGCWCMSWRVEKGERWEEIKGDEAKRRFRELVASGRARGVLAFDGDAPVGWAAYGPRASFPKLDRAPSFSCDDAAEVHALPCFFVARSHRGQGVAGAMLAAAVDALRAQGATIAEGYPTKPPKDGKPIPAAFAWTGTRSLFDAAGFQLAGNEDGGKQRVRLPLAGARAPVAHAKGAKATPAKPASTKSAKSAKSAKPASAKPASTKSAKPASAKSAKPASAKPASAKSAKPASAKSAKPASAKSAKPASAKSAKPAR